MIMCFFLPSNIERFEKKSLNLLYALINHKGEGSLHQCLTNLNFITRIDFETNQQITTAFRFISIQVHLTRNGIRHYKQVLALILKFFRIVRNDWLADGKTLNLFNECQTIAKLSYEIYNVPDGEDQVERLSLKMTENEKSKAKS